MTETNWPAVFSAGMIAGALVAAAGGSVAGSWHWVAFGGVMAMCSVASALLGLLDARL